MKYIYPAVFTPESAGYSVRFPDIENCYTFGVTVQEAVEMAQDVLNLMLWDMEDRKATVQPPSDPIAFTLEKGEFVALIAADTTEYRREMDSDVVKKTLSIPAWLNTLAEENHVDCSGALRDALKARLGVS